MITLKYEGAQDTVLRRRKRKQPFLSKIDKKNMAKSHINKDSILR